MTDNIYTGFGSHFVLEPRNTSLDDKNNESNGQWHNLKLQLKYFTLQAPINDAEKYVTKKNLKGNMNCGKSMNDTLSSESFHSCYSSFSNNELSKHSQEYDKTNWNRYSRNKRSDEEFHNQITMINAIFLSKKHPEGNQFKNEVLCKPDYSSGDTNSAYVCPDHKYPTQNQTGSLGAIQNRKEQHKQNIFNARNEIYYGKHCTINPELKSFKTYRKVTYATKKSFMSKINRTGHHQSHHKMKPLNSQIIKCHTEDIIPTNKVEQIEYDLHKGVFLQIKEGIHECYEVQFFEPMRQYSVAQCNYSEDANEHSHVDVVCRHKENNPHNQECELVNNFEDLKESFLKLFDNPNNIDYDVNPSGNVIVEFSNTNSKIKSDEAVFQNSDELNKDQKSISEEPTEEKNLTGTQESKTILPVLSQNTNLETMLENESWLEKTNVKYIKPIPCKSASSETIPADKSNKNASEPKETKTAHSTWTLNTKNNALSLHTRRRRSCSRNASLPVIEESPEPTQGSPEPNVPNDYCLVDTFGRPIHLYDFRGFPLTDDSGRPLRNAAGQLLLKCADNGCPVVDEKTQIFDVFGRQPHEEGFKPWESPHNFGTSRLTLGNRCPLLLFDIEGRPLTSISGTLLMDRNGRSLLKLRNCFFQPTLNN